MQLQPVPRSSAADEVYDQLVTSIVEGDIAAGEAMPPERALADVLGVSRPVVREALKRLAHAGLVRIRHGGATLVSDFRRTAGPELLSVLLLDRDGDLQLDVARSIVQARSDLGPPVAAAAARSAGAADVEDLAALLTQMGETDETDVLQRLALDFWDRLVDASGNVVYRLLFNALRAAYEPVMDALVVVMRDEVSDAAGYAAVLDATRRNDPDAAATAARALVDRGANAAVEVINRLLADAPELGAGVPDVTELDASGADVAQPDPPGPDPEPDPDEEDDR